MTVNVQYRELVGRTLETGELTVEEVDDVLEALDPLAGNPLPTDEADLAAVLDCHQAVRQIEPDDAAHPWNDAGMLKKMGHEFEAAAVYMRAAELFAIDAREGTGTTGDEDEWAQAALWHAVNSLLACKRPLTAAVVARRIEDVEYRREAEEAIQGWKGS